MKNNKLQELREKIDSIDRQIVELLKERIEIAKKIGKLKEDIGYESFDLLREKEILNKILKINEKIFPEDALKVIYSEIIKACRSVQQKIKVAYLGPEATFSHIAALNY
ncbi:MAG: prephenate dehydratase, partial [Thermodesulfobacterium geofontis]